MNENNLDYLKNSLKYLGFGEKLHDVLEKAIRQELPAFKLQLGVAYNPPNLPRNELPAKDHMSYELNFSKSKESDMYFLNSYQAKLYSSGVPEKDHNFNISSGTWITAKEAYNLLSGRSLLKEMSGREQDSEKVSAWMKLDLDVKDARGNYPARTFYPQYGYDLEKALNKYPIIDLQQNVLKEQIMSGLKKGNLTAANLKLDGKTVAVYLSANPEMKGIDIYDKKLIPIKDYPIWPDRQPNERDHSGGKNSISVQQEAEQGKQAKPSKQQQEQGEVKERSRGRS
ncbi:hypothetical protein [Pedobacter sp. SYSU D00535]|uniref:hypothetical protein n=1 Tax=Pedobacter sp. SYSU D00535 TaxID=2810308 RepID=UPI001A967F2E|nr:hypothetical protein [Pedobacter sp. SYSU D00535]